MSWARLGVYALLGALAGLLQFAAFDCNGLPVLSFLGAVATVAGGLVVIDTIYRVSVSSRSRAARLGLGAAIALAGLAGVYALASITVLTHICG